MVKSIKLYFAFLFISLFTINFVKTMEVGVENPTDSVQKKNEDQNKKLTRTQKKRISRKKGQQRIKEEELKRQIESEREQLREAGTIDNVRRLLNTNGDLDVYVLKLRILANLLLLQCWIANELKSISQHSKDLLDTASKNPVCCFSISEDGKGLCGNNEGECGITRQLLTPEAQSLALELIAPIIMDENFWNDSKLVNSFYYRSNKLIDHENEEISIIAKYVKNQISSYLFDGRINNLRISFLSSLSNMAFSKPDLFDEVEKLICNQGVSNLMASWLIRKNMFVIQQKLLPNLIDIALGLWDLQEYFNDLLNENADFSDIENASNIYNDINEIISLYERLEIVYKELYKTVVSELHMVLKENKLKDQFYRDVFLVPTKRVLSQDLEVPLLKFDFQDSDEEQQSSFIGDLISSHNNKKEVKNRNVKQNKKSRTRRNKKRSLEKEKNVTVKTESLETDNSINGSGNDCLTNEVEIFQNPNESVELPRYAKRVLDWFNPECVKLICPAPDADSILYHTYNPLADFFIEKYGIKQIQSNSSKPHINDTAYYMAGRLKYKDGKEKTVMCGICYGENLDEDTDKNLVCYHRGCDPKDKYSLLSKFEKNIYKYDFPDFSKDLIECSKIANLDDQGICNDLQFVETSFYIELYDSINGVKITLFKPD